MNKFKIPPVSVNIPPSKLPSIVGNYACRYGNIVFYEKSDYINVLEQIQEIVDKWKLTANTERNRLDIEQEIRSTLYGIGVHVKVKVRTKVQVYGQEYLLFPVESEKVFIFRTDDILDNNSLDITFEEAGC